MELGGVVAAAEEITEDAVQAIANRLDTRGDGFPLLLVNPTGTDYRGVCGASVYVPRAEKKEYPYAGRGRKRDCLRRILL